MTTKILIAVFAALLIATIGGGLYYQHVNASDAATKDLPAGYLRASTSFVTEFTAVEKAYTHLQARVPTGYVYDKALEGFRPMTAGERAVAGLPPAPAQPAAAPTPPAPAPAIPIPAPATPKPPAPVKK